MGDGFGEVAMVFSAIRVDCLLDTPPLFSYWGSAWDSCTCMWGWCCTVVEASEAYPKTKKSRHAIFLFQCCHIQIVVSTHPDLAESLEPCGGENLDVVAGFCDIAIFGAVDAADDEVGNIRSEVKLDGRAHLRANGCELGLHRDMGLAGVIEKTGRWWAYALLGGNRGAAEDGPSQGQLACPCIV